MKKIIIVSCLVSTIFAQNLELLTKDKKEAKELEKEIIQKEYDALKNDWISSLNLSSSLNRSHSFSDRNDKFSKSLSLSFTQSIYESGGIELSIKQAKNQFLSNLLSWENSNSQTFQTVYEVLLNMKKTKLQLEQTILELKNKEITLVLKKNQYENGDVDITELNNAIMSKNSQSKQVISLENSLKEYAFELSKYTDLKYEEINILDFSNIDKNDYLKRNIELLYNEALIEVSNTSYRQEKTKYLPKVSFSSKLSYSQNDDLIRNNDSDSTSGSVSLSLSMPLYDVNKKTNIEKSRLEVLKKRLELNDLKNELSKSFDTSLMAIDTYQKSNKIIENNIDLYADLIKVNESSNSVGMSSTYDLEILKNTKKINEYDLAINDINIQQEYLKLYFKMRKN